jgi:hypothetical protein
VDPGVPSDEDVILDFADEEIREIGTTDGMPELDRKPVVYAPVSREFFSIGGRTIVHRRSDATMRASMVSLSRIFSPTPRHTARE